MSSTRISLILLASFIACTAALSRPPEVRSGSNDGPLLPRPEVLRVIGAGHLGLLADLWWVQTIHQVGIAVNAAQSRDIYFFADLVTELDPKFYQVYPFAALSIPFNLGRENWQNGEESSRLLEKGLREFPDVYQLKFLRAYNTLFFAKDYQAAAAQLEQLSKDPKAPAMVAQLATRVYAQAGQFDAARALAESLAASSTDDESRQFFDHRLLEIEQEKIFQELDLKALEFSRKLGRSPATVLELMTEGLISAVPADPLGGAIFFDRSGRARSTATRYRLQALDNEVKKELVDSAEGMIPTE